MRRILVISLLFSASVNSAISSDMSCNHAARSSDLKNSIGFNTHLVQGWQYNNFNKTISELKYSGIVQIRDYFVGLGHAPTETAANAGIKFNFIIGPKWDNLITRKLELWEKKYPGSIISIEGPNEVNNWPVEINNLTGIPAAQKFQSLLFDAIKSNPILSHIPVVALTSWPVFSNEADIGNVHAYSRKSDNMKGEIDKGIDDEVLQNPKRRRFFITESGYHTLTGSNYYEGVSETAQAKLLLSLLLNASAINVEKTFIYQLLDQYTDSKDQQAHFGLIDLNWRRKPAFEAIRNLVSILSSGDNKGTWDLADLKYQIDGMPPTAVHKLYQIDSTTWIIAIWNNRNIWDQANHREFPELNSKVAIKFFDNSLFLSLIDPLKSTDPFAKSDSSGEIVFELGNSPLILRVNHKNSSNEKCLP